ncbi:putative transcriptional regulatory protein pdtaR [Oxobacter pfennigii]|uniref:Stage 0 sporulation protein A homolog n=1 Tax=Oxobacter pfennigii TaxID=36849 RepID=A0A0P8WX96_9CLOT|nr:ANTAR domain-containing protein [Oxobacter pfennigii]KPU42939.1 putative transcriptional regulatory protein pdtaR [Oxobacter pfennigii]
MESLKFAIGDENKRNIGIIRNILVSRGHTISCEEDEGPSLMRKIRSLAPDFVIVSYNMPGMKGLEVARIAQQDKLAPVLLTADSTHDIFVGSMGNEYYPYIIKPISEVQLLSTIEFVYNSFIHLKTLEGEITELKSTLETRKLVERAKGILIDSYNMKEKDAFRYLQKRSMDECKPVIEIAKRIIEKSKNIK